MTKYLIDTIYTIDSINCIDECILSDYIVSIKKNVIYIFLFWYFVTFIV